MAFKVVAEGVGKYRKVNYEFAIIDENGVKFAEFYYTLPSGKAVDVMDSGSFNSNEEAVQSAERQAIFWIDEWFREQLC